MRQREKLAIRPPAKGAKGKKANMKISEMVRKATTEKQAQQSHRDPNKVADALLKAEKDIYKMRGEHGGWVDASSWLGDMLNDAAGLSGSFYHDKELKKLKDDI